MITIKDTGKHIDLRIDKTGAIVWRMLSKQANMDIEPLLRWALDKGYEGIFKNRELISKYGSGRNNVKKEETP